MNNGIGKKAKGWESSVFKLMDSFLVAKQIQFHTPDANGKTKCHRLHMGKQNENCPKLLVHGTLMNVF